MDIMHEKTVLDTIREYQNKIYSAEKKVANFILENPEKAINLNVSELAKQSDVSDATVVRFCKRIGYQGYYQLKLFLSRDLGRKQILNEEIDPLSLNAVGDMVRNYAAELISIGKTLQQESILDCVNSIRSCDFVHLVAVGNTSPLAQYMGFRLGRLGVRSTNNMIPEYFMNQVNLASSNDLILAISQSGSSKQVIQAAELAKEKGLKVIAITAYEYSPLSQLADTLLISGTSTMQKEFNYYQSYSHLREVTVIDILLQFLTNEELIIKSRADKPEVIMSEYKL